MKRKSTLGISKDSCSRTSRADTERTPQRIVAALAADQITVVAGDRRPAGFPVPDLPCPIEPKSFAVPANHGVGFDDRERRPPPTPDSAEHHSENSVRHGQLRLFDGALQDSNLMPESDAFQQRGSAGFQSRGQAPKRHPHREECLLDETIADTQLPSAQTVRDLREAQVEQGMAVPRAWTLLGVPSPSWAVPLGSRSSLTGLISLVVICAGARSAGNPHATCDVAGAGNQLTVRIVRNSQRKRGVTDRPDLRSHRASLRPYQNEAGECRPRRDRPHGREAVMRAKSRRRVSGSTQTQAPVAKASTSGTPKPPRTP